MPLPDTALTVYGKTTKSTHYLPRKGSYSTVPKRNGLVDVLPPSARVPLYDIGAQIVDATERLQALRAVRDAAKEQILSLSRFDQLRGRVGSRGSECDTIKRLQAEVAHAEEQMTCARKRAGELRAIVSGGSGVTFESVFVRLARAELPDYLYRALEQKASHIVRVAK